ncbi:MAG: hypothetical protein DRN29_09310 [Thermoplasmata archaeon]|nr:MAG: hypothetical protein DRN29_09310 [Thermoplasmata archaeon]
MKKVLLAIFMLLAFVFPMLLTEVSASDSWIRIVEPSPGIYWKGEKIYSLDNAIIIIGENSMHVEAEGSENIIAVYFSLYDVRGKDMVASYWDMNGNDGWQCDFELSKGIFILAAAGAALDIEEPVAIDWFPVIAWC